MFAKIFGEINTECGSELLERRFFPGLEPHRGYWESRSEWWIHNKTCGIPVEWVQDNGGGSSYSKNGGGVCNVILERGGGSGGRPKVRPSGIQRQVWSVQVAVRRPRHPAEES